MAILDEGMLKVRGRVGDITIYQKGDKTIVRKAHNAKKSKKKKKRMTTLNQFIQRQRLQRNNALWRVLKKTGEVFFEGGLSACHRFRSINQDVPDVFLDKYQLLNNSTLLLPGMVLSDGPVPSINYQLEKWNGQFVLKTDLTEEDAQKGRLLLYVLRQEVYQNEFCGVLVDERLTVSAKMVEVNSAAETQAISGLAVAFVDGCMVLTGDMFADEMSGFGLVHVIDGHASTQHLVTRCTYYERYATKEALQAAFKEYKKI